MTGHTVYSPPDRGLTVIMDLSGLALGFLIQRCKKMM